jgi:AAA+ superfamily predicted ATPase
MSMDEDRNSSVQTDDRTFVWSPASPATFRLTAHALQSCIHTNASGVLLQQVVLQEAFEHAPGATEPVVVSGTLAFFLDGVQCDLSCDAEHHSIRLRGNQNVGPIVERLRDHVRRNNAYRRQHVQVTMNAHELSATLKPAPQTALDEVILDAAVKEDVLDNTVRQLTEFNTSNGVIFHGPPGTGKSLLCRALIRQAIDAGVSTAFVVGRVDFSELDELVRDYLAPCLLVLEDVDAYAEDRTSLAHSQIADFLQFMSGLTEREDPVVAVATTNFLDRLDHAVRNRPMRFSRKYRIGLPNDEQVDALVARYFDGVPLTDEDRHLCHDQGFTGAHIAEIRRTAELLTRRTAKPLEAIFRDAVRTVSGQFVEDRKPAGFGK